MESLVSIINSIRRSIGNQWRFVRTGLIRQNLGERVTTRAAAFCTRWSCLITFLGDIVTNYNSQALM